MRPESPVLYSNSLLHNTLNIQLS